MAGREALAAALPRSASAAALASLGAAAGAAAAGGGAGAGGPEQHEEFDLAMTQMHRDLAAMYKSRCAGWSGC